MRTFLRFMHAFVMAVALFGTFGTAFGTTIINGFGDFSPSEWLKNQSDSLSAPLIMPAPPPGGTIQLTTSESSTADEDRSIFYTNPVPISTSAGGNALGFTASFDYRVTGTNAYPYDPPGAAFILQNSPQGASAVAAAGPFKDNLFGYGGTGGTGNGGISNSFAVVLNVASDTTGTYTNGTITALGQGRSAGPLHFLSGDSFHVVLSYDPTLLQLSESVTDTTTNTAMPTIVYGLTKPIESVVGGSTAYVGLTAGGSQDAQVFSNFKYSITPEPTTFFIGLVGAAILLVFARRQQAQQS